MGYGKGRRAIGALFCFAESAGSANALSVRVNSPIKTRSVILTKVRTQSHEDLRVVPWVLAFARMTDGIGLAEIPSILPCKGRWQRGALTEG